jgi:hypothetical protein
LWPSHYTIGAYRWSTTRSVIQRLTGPFVEALTTSYKLSSECCFVFIYLSHCVSWSCYLSYWRVH